jgi:hypothetical protein
MKTLSNTTDPPMDDSEVARYLASYLYENSDLFTFYDGIKSIVDFDQDQLAYLIKKFYEELP